MNPFLAILLFVVVFAILLTASVIARRRGAHPEWTRKALHVGMGVAVLTFPWVFSEKWPVLVLSAGFVLVMLAMRLLPALGATMTGVSRVSLGEFYFPVAVGGLFLLMENKMEYLVPMLVLTFADAAAALVGISAGRHHYTADEGVKSWEGTAAFCVTAFLCAFVPLMVSGMDGPRAALIATCVSLIGGIIEATAWQGTDNLLLPFSTLLMLRIYAELPLTQLWLRMGLLATLVLIFLVLRRRMLLREGTALGALLAIYLCWVFGDPRWVIAPLMMVLVHGIPARWIPSGVEVSRPGHHALLALILPPLAWVFAWRFSGEAVCFAAFHTALAAQLAMTVLAICRSDMQGGCRLVAPAWLVAMVAVGLPWWWLDEARSLPTAWRGAGAVFAAALLFHFSLRRVGDSPALEHWTWRGMLAVLASLAV